MGHLTGYLSRSLRQSFALLALGLTFSVPVFAAPLWEIQGQANRIYLLGSVHVLRKEDARLPAAADAAYEDADAVVFEIDLAKVSPIEVAGIVSKIAVDPEGRDLQDLLGADAWNEARESAGRINLDLELMRPYKPWFAAIQITMLRLAQLGFDDSHGIEAQIQRRAQADNKPTAGLETIEKQLQAI